MPRSVLMRASLEVGAAEPPTAASSDDYRARVSTLLQRGHALTDAYPGSGYRPGMAMRGVVERPSGLVHKPAFLAPQEEARLLEIFAGLETVPLVMHGVESRRRVRHYGVGYDFDRWTTSPAEPVPDHLLDLRDRCARLAGVPPESFEEALVTEYPVGASIGWHRDAAVFGSVVVGVSLGSDSVLRFQRRAAGGERRVFEQPLERRSAYVLSGAARHAWQHMVPAVREVRWSVTFRQLRRPDHPPR